MNYYYNRTILQFNYYFWVSKFLENQIVLNSGFITKSSLLLWLLHNLLGLLGVRFEIIYEFSIWRPLNLWYLLLVLSFKYEENNKYFIALEEKNSQRLFFVDSWAALDQSWAILKLGVSSIMRTSSHTESQALGCLLLLTVHIQRQGINAWTTKNYSAFKTLSSINPLLVPDAGGPPYQSFSQTPISVSPLCQRSVLAGSLQGTRNQPRRHT